MISMMAACRIMGIGASGITAFTEGRIFAEVHKLLCLLYCFMQKQFVEGIALGGVKG